MLYILYSLYYLSLIDVKHIILFKEMDNYILGNNYYHQYYFNYFYLYLTILPYYIVLLIDYCHHKKEMVK